MERERELPSAIQLQMATIAREGLDKVRSLEVHPGLSHELHEVKHVISFSLIFPTRNSNSVAERTDGESGHLCLLYILETLQLFLHLVC